MTTRNVILFFPISVFASLPVIASPQSKSKSTTPRTELPSGVVTVPMHSWGGRPVVEARINGKELLKFILDTGTDIPVVLDEATMKKLGLSVTGSTKESFSEETLDTFEVGSLSIGDATFRSVTGIRSDNAACMASEGVVGIVGLPLFEDCLFTLDFPQKTIHFEAGELPWPEPDTLEYSADKVHDYGVTLTLSVAGVPVKAHIDTGSPSLLTLLNKFQKKLPLKGKPVVVGIARTPQGEAQVRSARLDGVLKLGRHEWKKPRIDFADLGPMLDYDAGNIGSRLLNDFAVTVDQKNHRVRFRKPGDDRK